MKHFTDNMHRFSVKMIVRDNLSTDNAEADLKMFQDALTHFVNDNGDYDILSLEIQKCQESEG